MFKDDVIEITFPGAYSTQTDELTLPTGKAKVVTRQCTFGTLGYDVVICDMPPGTPNSFEGAAEAVVKKSRGNLKSFEKLLRWFLSRKTERIKQVTTILACNE